MSPHRLAVLLFLMAAFVRGALAAGAEKAEAESSAQNIPSPPPTLEASVKGDDFVGNRIVNHAYVSYGTNRFSFVVPEGCHVDGASGEKLVVVNEGYDCFLSFRVVGPLPAGNRELQPEVCRQLLLSRYPGATISEEYSRSVANHSGPAFDFQWLNSSGAPQSGRVVFVPMAAGFVEFSLITTVEKAISGQTLFHRFLLTFRTDESGKLDVVHFAEAI